MGSESDSGARPVEPHRTLEIRSTLFGSTLAEVAVAMNEMPTGGVLAVRTNDP
jgi:hypothetical protein